jgi:phenylacetate-coenzyme A ligase PaaK-like adenylate-forming protein
MMTVPPTPLEAWVKAKIGIPAHQDLGLDLLTAYHLEKLRATLDYVKRRSPFYRHRFAAHDPASLHRPADLGHWPMTTADDLRRGSLAFLCVSQSMVERVVTLPARSAQERPRRLFFSAADLELAVDFFHQGFRTLVAPKQRMLVLMPCRNPSSVGNLLAQGLARLSVGAVTLGPLNSPVEAVDAIRGSHIDCLVGVPSEMAALTHYPGAARIPSGQIRSLWLGTQNTRRSVAEEIGRFWGCPVFQHYGPPELCPGGGVQCGARDGFHLREADLFIEIVDPRTALPLEDGRYGEVVVTTLTREAMPLVRYRTGHIAAIMIEPCPCGSRLRRLTSLRNPG